jgi:hypothetical protein
MRTGQDAKRLCVRLYGPVLMGSCSICAAKSGGMHKSLYGSESKDRRAQSG